MTCPRSLHDEVVYGTRTAAASANGSINPTTPPSPSMRHIKLALTKGMSQTIACSLVSSRLDYANSLFVGVSDLEVKRMQRIKNSLARVVLCVPLRTCSSVLLHKLHWLPVEFKIRFKLACLTYKALSTSKPTYLHALLTPYTPPRCLRSSGTRLLAEPRYRTVMGSREFHFSVPREWIRLPLTLRSTNSLPSFKKRFKLINFFLAFKERIGKLIGIHLVAKYPRLRFTFRCDQARVINLI